MDLCSTKPKVAEKEKQKKSTPAKVQSSSKAESSGSFDSQRPKKSRLAASSLSTKKSPSTKSAPPKRSPQLPTNPVSAAKSLPATKSPSKISMPQPLFLSQPSKKPSSEVKSMTATRSPYKKPTPPNSVSKPSKKSCTANKSSQTSPSPLEAHLPRQSRPEPTEHSPKLIKRFYEPLILLHTLGNVRGESDSCEPSRRSSFSGLSSKDRRRQFLDALAFVCDYERGGDSVAAIGLESTPQCHVFWVAANTCPKKKMVPFVRSLLEELKSMGMNRISIEQSTVLIAKQCLRFGERRIKGTIQMLQKQIEKCQRLFLRSVSDDGPSLSVDEVFIWLRRFQHLHLDEPGIYNICFFAYENRKCTAMRSLGSLSQEPTHFAGTDAPHLEYKQLRHLVGRLAHQFRTAKKIASHGSALLYLLDDCKVSSIIPPKTLDPPLPAAEDKLLDGILTRMLPKDSADLPKYRQDLEFMSTHFQLATRLLAQYRNRNFKPRVHAELQILEHFHLNNLDFEDSDRYIACSKPACYCCALYIRHHHGSFVVPESHRKIWLNWRPPDVEAHEKKAQEKILNAMIADIRKEAFDQIAGRTKRSHWRPDSFTGITVSTRQEFGDQDIETDVEEEFESEGLLV
ncbi:hypothetical protein Vi05172_g4462 [Venturia inaequalis]|nr:hypothetical protein Vi05172_g4462 [Venturia inaequalis]